MRYFKFADLNKQTNLMEAKKNQRKETDIAANLR